MVQFGIFTFGNSSWHQKYSISKIGQAYKKDRVKLFQKSFMRLTPGSPMRGIAGASSALSIIFSRGLRMFPLALSFKNCYIACKMRLKYLVLSSKQLKIYSKNPIFN